MRRLPRFPNYERSLDVDAIDASDLDDASFRRAYVLQNKPLLIRRGAAGWPAARWNIQRLRECLLKVDNLFENAVGMVDTPFGEYASAASGTARSAITRLRPTMGGADFVDRLEKGQGEDLVAYGVPLCRTPGIEHLWNEFGELPFLKGGAPHEFLYEHRMFIYRGGYTDWHFHYGDEGLTAQFMSRKEFLLLPPDTETFDSMWRIARRHRFSDIDLRADASTSSLRPHRVVLNSGDVLYIPVFWWHAVEPLDGDIGVTCAFAFRSPLHIQWDMRFPAARWNLGQALRRPRFWPVVPLQILGALWAVARSPLSPTYLRRRDAASA